MSESNAAAKAWAEEKRAYARSAYVAGYDQGSFEERQRVVAFIGENQDFLKTFAGNRGMDLLSYMLREMKPESTSSGSTPDTNTEEPS